MKNQTRRETMFFALVSMLALRMKASATDLTLEPPPAFKPGEKLKYDLGWSFMKVGRATTEILPDTQYKGEPARQFRMTVRTASVVDKIYKIRDSLTAYSSMDVSRSFLYEKTQREGKTKRDVQVEFDWETKQATYTDKLKKRKREPIPILDGCLDPLSAFYFVRNQTFDVGSVLRGPITDGKKCMTAELRVVKRERIKVDGKKYNTFLVVPDIKDIGGVFKKSKDAKIEIWITTDYRHIPVRMRSKVVVGSFFCELKA